MFISPLLGAHVGGGLLQASLMGVTILLFWVRGICPDIGWGRFHTLRGVKDTPAGAYVGDGEAAGLVGWIRTAEQRCGFRLEGTGGRPGAHAAAPSVLLCDSPPELRTVPWGLRGDGDMGALPPSRAAPPRLSLCLHFLLPGPALPRFRSSSQMLRSGTGPAERVPLSGRPAGGRGSGSGGRCGSGGRAASPRLSPYPPAAAGLGPPSASAAPWLLLVLPRVIFIASISCAGINK